MLFVLRVRKKPEVMIGYSRYLDTEIIKDMFTFNHIVKNVEEGNNS